MKARGLVFTPRRTLAFHYFLYFAVLGVYLPYFNPYCRHLGFSGSEIGWITGTRSAAVIILPMIWAWLADRYQARRLIFILCNFVSTGFFLLYFATESFYPMLVITALYSVFYAPIIAFLEAFSMEILGRDKNSYGRIRVWGSLAFILTVMGVGRLMSLLSPAVVLWAIAAGATIQAVLSTRMPDTDTSTPPPRARDAKLFFEPRILAFLLAAFLMLVSHGTYYTFYSIHMEENLGFPYWLISVVWALGTLAEVGVMLKSRPILDRFRPQSVIAFSLLVAVFRWIIVGTFESAWILVPAQALHAATYGTFHIASIVYIEKLIPESARTTGQAVNNSMTYGAGLAVGGVVSGYLYELVSAPVAFYAMSGVALLGLVLFRGQVVLAKREAEQA